MRKSKCNALYPTLVFTICFCVPKKKESLTGLKQHKWRQNFYTWKNYSFNVCFYFKYWTPSRVNGSTLKPLMKKSSRAEKSSLDIIPSLWNALCHMLLLSAPTLFPHTGNSQHGNTLKQWRRPATCHLNINHYHQLNFYNQKVKFTRSHNIASQNLWGLMANHQPFFICLGILS